MAATLAWLFAEKPDFGMSPGMLASPTTQTPSAFCEAMLAGTIGHQPLSLVSPAMCAISPARCAGMTLATAASWVSPPAVRVMALASTAVTLPPNSSGIHSTMPS